MWKLMGILFVLSVSAQSLDLNTLLMPANKLAVVKAALPVIANSNLKTILNHPGTVWYDHNVMKPSYQDSVGASSNDKWPDLVASQAADGIKGLHNRQKHRWNFPFAITAGLDNSTNMQVENFVFFPQSETQVQTMLITKVLKNYNRPQWMWTYPEGTVFGEIIFITDNGKLLPVEIRTRTRYSTGWSSNAFRPFPRAVDLVKAIKKLRPNWSEQSNLKSMIAFLEDNTTLTASQLNAVDKLAPTFQQNGYLDILPDFGDDELVRELLTKTAFVSAYDTNWKESGSRVTYAASTNSPLSIVPTNYTAGLIRVTDDSCMRCHKEGGRLCSEFYGSLYLYGEVWGKDGIFTFHPFDESRYPELRHDNIDNRSLNYKLKQAGIFRTSFK